ncbi:maleylpyruvate isomerase N-terminal domain-containing protein [Actinoplanes sp. HUAS TT8]|uniref:maleylpyruvate isomerase N-terminal domain-containing protein n=1 Tax=Actinoplanes sp. HUAS TT8 TaxID=3447453 RepID=UPI003F51D576
MNVRDVYLESAEITTTLVTHPAVARCWDTPSALAKMRVGGLTAHLVSQIIQVGPVLDAPAADELVSLQEHFARSTWIDDGLDSEVHTYIRRTAEAEATAGAPALATAAATALAELRRRLPAEPPDRVIQLPFGPWSLTLDDYLVTRLLELTVHGDDLATSIGVETPAVPPACFDTVVGVLSHLAARRHGQTALLRALSRAE